MILHKLIYALLWVCSVLFFVMYRGALSLQLLIVCTLFPILLFLLLLWQKLTLSVQLEADTDEAACKDRFYVLMHMRGRCPVPVHYAVVTFNYIHTIAGQTDMLDVHVPVMGRNAQVVRLPFSTPCCGKITVTGSDVLIYDPLSLFSMKVRCRDRVSVTILPETDCLQTVPPLPHPAAAEQSERFSEVRAGDDPSEVFSVEPYQQGDAVSRVHWKLTAKTDAMMIKHFSLPLDDDILLFADYRRFGSEFKDTMLLHHVISVVASLSCLLTEQGCDHRLLWYPYVRGGTEPYFCRSREDTMDALRLLLAAVPYPVGEAAVLGMEEPPAARMIYCTAALDTETVMHLSAAAVRCRLMVFYICHEEHPVLPADMQFECCPVYIPLETEEEVQHD